MTAFLVGNLETWANNLLSRLGCEPDKAEAVAATLIEGDLLGHDTHGLALLGPYLSELQRGNMAGTGSVTVLNDRPAALLWDGATDSGKLPGPWLVQQAILAASERATDLGASTVVIRSAGHIACLAAYLEAPAREGFVIEIMSSDPSVCSVAPFGAKTPVFTPNPIGIGIPTSNDPILIDISTSLTTNGMSARLAAQGARFDHPWLLDNTGRASNDPAVFGTDPPGTIQLLGGLDCGHKGYGLSLMVEALTGGLAGFGRADGAQGWGATVMVRLTQLDAFAGTADFERQLDWLVHACRTSAPIEPNRAIRLPGERGLARKRQALAHGLRLNPLVLALLNDLADEHNLPLPS